MGKEVSGRIWTEVIGEIPRRRGNDRRRPGDPIVIRPNKNEQRHEEAIARKQAKKERKAQENKRKKDEKAQSDVEKAEINAAQTSKVKHTRHKFSPKPTPEQVFSIPAVPEHSGSKYGSKRQSRRDKNYYDNSR